MPDTQQECIEAIADQLRAKIVGKVQSATFLAGFTIALLSVEITILWTDNKPLSIPVAMAILIFALLLFIKAVLQLDGLTMPKRFWPEDKRATKRPPTYMSDNDLWGIQKRMVFLWSRLVVVGLYASVSSLLLMTVPIPAKTTQYIISISFISSLVGVVAAIFYIRGRANEENQGFPPLVRPED